MVFPSIFIFTLLFAPKSTVWLKDEVSMSAPVKVDNIPIGIAMFASLSSQTSYFVSKMLEIIFYLLMKDYQAEKLALCLELRL
ncbi:conjugal transfer protein TraG N-terminal domain-containing protein [Orientia tsutsugamushi]|uniref:conjugal transfer protein TraG N-terminal domain-containing protein n=1 Tax=Orientia tsutsugamushi TaxID=784 RepID=UPI0020935B11|nr:conjugal transfer protein TraG N-terminal domain-containing protein [Orientia tsutsugamushi]